MTFGTTLRSWFGLGSRADSSAVKGVWLCIGDFGVYLDGELYVTGSIANLMTIGNRNHYPQDVEVTAADASPMVRRGYVTAFSVPANAVLRATSDNTSPQLVIIAKLRGGHRQSRLAASDQGHSSNASVSSRVVCR